MVSDGQGQADWCTPAIGCRVPARIQGWAAHSASLRSMPPLCCTIHAGEEEVDDAVSKIAADDAAVLDETSEEEEEATTIQSEPSVSKAASAMEKFFFDRAELFVRSGAGGKGTVAYTQKSPSGGSGGRGGSVYVQCTDDLNTLEHLRSEPNAKAKRGFDAEGKESGKFGKDAVVRVPPNTLVYNRETNALIGKLSQPGERILIALGGEGGEGNKVNWNRERTAHAWKSVGKAPGGTEKLWIVLKMTLIADVGLVGMPSVGKSTLLRAVSKARPKVAEYHFTTLIPNLGVCQMERFQLREKSMVWLDIPGLIEGAASGKGLGLAFLRHAERCRLILHLIDGNSEDPVGELRAINGELAKFSPMLGSTPQVVLLTKTDLPEVMDVAEAKVAELREAVGHGRVLQISSHTKDNIGKLLKRTRGLLDQLDAREEAKAAALAAALAAAAAEEKNSTAADGEEGEGAEETAWPVRDGVEYTKQRPPGSDPPRFIGQHR